MTQTIKNLRQITAAALVFILTSSIALAQPSGQQSPPPIPSDKQITKMVNKLDKELDLSDKQEEKVSKHYFAHFEEVESLQKSSQRPSRTEMERLESSFEAGVKEVLNDEQQKLYTTWLKKQKKQRSQGGQPQGGQGGQRPPR